MIFQVKDNTITAYGTIWDGNGMDFVSIFTQLESKYEQIFVKLHTYGGSVFDGNLMFNALCNSKKSVVLQIVGIAASMGAVMALSLDEVYMVENGYLMIHTASGQTYGSALDHENNAKLLRSIESNFLKKLVKKTGKPESYVKKWLTGDNWFDAETAMKEGLIKGIIEPETKTENFNPEQLGVTETYNRFSALLLPTETVKQKLDQDMKKPIIEALGLKDVTAESSDTAVIDAVRNHYEAKIKKAEDDLKKEKTKSEAAEAKLKEQSKAVITAELETAKKQGKITQDDFATYEGIAEASGLETLKKVLAAIPVRKPITSQINSGSGIGTVSGPEGRENWDFDKWQKEDPKGFEALAKNEPETFEALLKAKYSK